MVSYLREIWIRDIPLCTDLHIKISHHPVPKENELIVQVREIKSDYLVVKLLGFMHSHSEKMIDPVGELDHSLDLIQISFEDLISYKELDYSLAPLYINWYWLSRSLKHSFFGS